jgi:hypothetical protein
MSNPYIVFTGNSRNNMQPFMSAPDRSTAIREAIRLEANNKCVEATFMPEENLDVNVIVYARYKD